MISQSGLHPSNCRLLDPLEAETTGAGDGSSAVLILGFESAFAPVDEPLRLAVECAAGLGGRPEADPGADAEERLGRPDLALGLPRRPLPARQPRRASGSSARPSRPRSPGTGSASSTRGSARRRGAPSPRSATRRRDGEGAPRVMCRFTHVYPERSGALLHGARQGPARLRGRAVGRDQGGRLGGDHLGRRDDHPSPRGRPRSSPLVRPAAPDRFAAALGAAKRGGRPGGDPQPGRARRCRSRAALTFPVGFPDLGSGVPASPASEEESDRWI